MPQSSLYFGLTSRWRISIRAPVSASRTALRISGGKRRWAACAAVKGLPETKLWMCTHDRSVSWVRVRSWVRLRVLREGASSYWTGGARFARRGGGGSLGGGSRGECCDCSTWRLLGVMGEFPNSRRVGVTGGATLGDRALVWMVLDGVNREDMRGWPTLGGVAGDRDGFMSTGTLGSSSGMTCVNGSEL